MMHFKNTTRLAISAGLCASLLLGGAPAFADVVEVASLESMGLATTSDSQDESAAPTPVADGPVEYNGETYATLADAFVAAKAGGTITLNDDLAVETMEAADARGLTGDVVLNLNGHTVYGQNNNIAIRVLDADGGSLTIKNGSIDAQLGTFCTVGASKAPLTIEDVKLSNSTSYGSSIKAFGGGVITVKNCTSTSVQGGAVAAAGGTVNLYDCEFSQSEYYDWNSCLVSASNGTGVVNVYSGTYTSENYGAYIFTSGGTINFYGGTMKVTGDKPAFKAELDLGTYPDAKGQMKIADGVFQGGFDLAKDIDMSISGGSFSVAPDTSYLAPGFKFDAETGSVVENENIVATVLKDGEVASASETLGEAMLAAGEGTTVQLQKDVVLTKGVKLPGKVSGVTLDLNGHNIDGKAVTSDDGVVSMSTKYGWKPTEGADRTMSIVNSVPEQGGSIAGALPVSFASGDSSYTLPAVVGEGVKLVTTDPNADAVKLGSSAYLVYSESTKDLIKNGGFKVAVDDAERIYGSYANAAGAATGERPVVTLLNNLSTNESLYSGSQSAILDLNGKTITFTNKSDMIKMTENDVDLEIRNGKLVGTAASVPSGANFAGVDAAHVRSNVSLTLDNVVMKVPGASYGLVTNGATTKDCRITLRNSTLDVAEGVPIYFPSTGSVTIDNSIINGKYTGVQMCAGDLMVTGDDTKITVTGEPIPKTDGDGSIDDGAAISIVSRQGYQKLGNVSINGGTFVSAPGVPTVKAYSFNNTNKVEEAWDEAGDVVGIAAGTFSKVPDNMAALCADGFEPQKNDDGTISVKPAEDTVATMTVNGQIKAFDSLEAAVKAAPQGERATIKLLKDFTGNGVQVKSGYDIVFDLCGNTYTIDGTTVGSAGTETNGFQLLKDSSITFMNGSIVSDKAAILIQNYSNLTLEGVTLKGGKSTQATLSNNNGDILIGKGTNIIAGEADPKIAFDVYQFASYDHVNVTVSEDAGKIVGEINVSGDGTSKAPLSLCVKGGDLTEATLKVDPTAADPTIQFAGGELGFRPEPEHLAPGFGVTENADGTFGVHKHRLSKVAAKPATCTEDGVVEHWVCSECDVLFKDEAMTEEIAPEDVVVKATGHDVAAAIHHEGRAATVDAEGVIEHWECPVCGDLFLDAGLTKPVSAEDVVLPKLDPEPEKVDKAALSQLIGDAKQVSTEGKSDKVVAEYKAALAKAIAVVEDEDATQDEVDAAFARLSAALTALDADKGEPGEGEKPGPKPDVKPGEGQDGEDDEPSKGDTLPTTGEDSMLPIAVAGVAGVGAVAAGVAVTAQRRKQQ